MTIYRGWIDEMSSRLIRGWCDPLGHPSVYVNGKLVGVAELSGPREDASPTATGFLFRPSRFFVPGRNDVRVVFPDGTVPEGGEKMIFHDADPVTANNSR